MQTPADNYKNALKDIFFLGRCHTFAIQHDQIIVVLLLDLAAPAKTAWSDSLTSEDADLVVHERRLAGRHMNVNVSLGQFWDHLRLRPIVARIALGRVRDDDFDATFARSDHGVYDPRFRQREDGDVRRLLRPGDVVNDGLGTVELRVTAGRRAKAEEFAAHGACRRQ